MKMSDKDTPDLFPPAPPPTLPHNWTDTSKAAAKKHRTAAATDRDRILEALRVRGDFTCDELEQLLDMKHQTAAARMSELWRENRIAKTGLKRNTRGGCAAAVYKYVEGGKS